MLWDCGAEHALRSRREMRYTDGFSRRLFGFFFGSTLTGAGIYYYVLDEYKLSNELLTEDIYVSAACYCERDVFLTYN